MLALAACALLLAPAAPVPAAPGPASFEIHSGHRALVDDYVVGELPFDLEIVARDPAGEDALGFNGTIILEGLEGAPAGPYRMEHGRLLVENVRLERGTLTLRSGDMVQQWSPRIIPGWLSIVPPLIAIALAIITRQVLVALFSGIWIGAFFLAGMNPFTALLRSFDKLLLNNIADTDNAAIMMFTVALGGMVGVLSRSGGTKALVEAISRRARSRRWGMLTGWMLGVIIFFDDYANCLLVGNTVRPFTDSLRISREKLSFIVDSTAAPVATIAIVSTWIGYQLGQLRAAGVVPAGQEYVTFLSMLPYSFYSFFALYFTFLVAVSEKDFGPMLKAERRAFSTGQLVRPGGQPLMDRELADAGIPDGGRLNPWNAIVPVAGVISIVILGLYFSGVTAMGAEASAASLREIVSNADSYAVLTWAAFGGSLLALAMSMLTRALKLSEGIDAWIAGGKAMMIAVFILVLAWTLGDVCRSYLQTGPWIISQVSPPAHFMPAIIFLVSAAISFTTGTSFGTMAIVIPIAGPMIWALTGDGSGMGDVAVHSIRHATLASVLGGAVFGDHCSPISDTTIMSSMSSGSDHVDHVRTQIPYAALCAAVAVALGFIPAGLGWPPWISVAAGLLVLTAVLLFWGRRADSLERDPAG